MEVKIAETFVGPDGGISVKVIYPNLGNDSEVLTYPAGTNSQDILTQVKDHATTIWNNYQMEQQLGSELNNQIIQV